MRICVCVCVCACVCACTLCENDVDKNSLLIHRKHFFSYRHKEKYIEREMMRTGEISERVRNEEGREK